MRLLKSDINPSTQKGTVKLRPDEPEDMWHLYNLIRPTDIVRSTTRRKVVKESNTGLDTRASTSTKVVHVNLAVMVTKLDFDPQAAQLHVSGRVCDDNPYVEKWAFHTLDLELQSTLDLTKGSDLTAPALDKHTRKEQKDTLGTLDPSVWDTIATDMLSEATDERNAASSWAIVMDEGAASIVLLTEHQRIIRQRIEVPLPRKRLGHTGDAHAKAQTRFHEQTLAALRRHLDISGATHAKSADASATPAPPPLVLGSPGFAASSFRAYMADTAQRTGDKALATYARSSVLVVHTSSGHVHALSEALSSPAARAALSETRFARETALMERFMRLLREDAGWAWYGPGEVARAVGQGAVGRGGGVLLISNALFRSFDVGVRRRWVGVVERVRADGGEVRVLSSAHESGRKLEGLGEIGAILTYPILDLDEEEVEEDGGG